MSNVFDSSRVIFVPDSQLIFPKIFFKNRTRIKAMCQTYKTCFKLMQEHCNYLILPSNEVDFNNLITSKFFNFLKDINEEIKSARQNGFQKSTFYRNTWNRLNWTNKDYGDLLSYWNQERETFWDFVSIDPYLALEKQRKIALSKTQLFANEVCKDHKITFSDPEEALSDSYFTKIKGCLRTGTINPVANPNEADIKILTDCLVYNEKRLESGIMYLVTGDKKLEQLAQEIVNNPQLIYPDVTEGNKLAGFRPLKPLTFIRDVKKHFGIN